MRQYRIKRRVGQYAVTENGILTVDMPRGYDYESIGFRLAGGIQVTTNFTAVRAENPIQLIKRIELVADGKNTIDSVTGVLINRANMFRRGQLGTLVPASGFVVATYQVNASGIIDRALIDGIRPKDANMRTSGMQLLQLRFTFGAVVDCFTGAGVGVLSAMLIDVWTNELVEIADANEQLTKPLFLLKRSYQDITITAANANLEVILPIGNVMRGIVARLEGNPTAGEPSDQVCNDITLRSGVDVRLNLPYLVAREGCKMDYDITTLPPGIVVADLMHMGQQAGVRASEGWDLTNASEAKLVLDVNGTGTPKASIMTMELLS